MQRIDYHALAIINVLQIVVDSDVVAQSQEQWMQLLPILAQALSKNAISVFLSVLQANLATAGDCSKPEDIGPSVIGGVLPDHEEIRSALVLFSDTLFERAPTRLKSRYEREMAKIRGLHS